MSTTVVVQEEKKTNPVVAVLGLLMAILFIGWKIFVFRRAGRSGSGWAVFFSMLAFPFDALVFLWKKKECIAIPSK